MQFVIQIEFNFNNFIFYGVSATAGHVPAGYAVVAAGGCDWPLPSTAGLSNNDVIGLRALHQLRQLRYVSYVPYVPYVSSVTFLTLLALRWMETPLKAGMWVSHFPGASRNVCFVPRMRDARCARTLQSVKIRPMPMLYTTHSETE